MKKKFLLIILILIATLSSCKNNGTPDDEENEYFIEFTTEKLNIYSFDVHELPINTNAEDHLIKYSSSNEEIVKINNNSIIPISGGTAEITASLEDGKTDSMVVVVEEDGNVPYLSVSEDEISLFENSTYSIKSTVSLRGKEVDATYSYTSTDTNIVTVNESGNIIAVSSGLAYINVVANYNGYSGDEYYSLSRTVKVIVQPQIILSISCDSLKINNRIDTINDVEYSNQTNLSGFFVVNGEYKNIFDSDVTWVSSNSNVAVIEGEKIIAKEVGTTDIYAVKTIDDVVYTSNYLTISVEKPMVLVNNDPIDIDLYTNEINLSTGYMCNNDETILNIYDSANPTLKIYDGEKLTNYEEIGPREWIVESTNNCYLINVISCSKIITTKDELASLHTYGKNVVKGSSGIVSFDGYFILGSDIDMKGVRFRTFCGIGTGATSVLYNGFLGTFDGRGHTITNASVAASNGGLFGTMNKSSIVKNVAFKNATVSGDSGLISSNFAGTIENVYVEGKLTCTRASATSPSSLLVSKIYDGAKISNCIIMITNSTVNNNYSSAIGMLVSAKEDAFKNVYVLGTDFKVFSTSAGDKYNTFTYENNGQFVEYSNLLDKDLTSFNNYWIFGDGGISFSASH